MMIILKVCPKMNGHFLIQGVDKHILEVYELIEEFNFIPRWRFDDVMISFALKEEVLALTMITMMSFYFRALEKDNGK